MTQGSIHHFGTAGGKRLAGNASTKKCCGLKGVELLALAWASARWRGRCPDGPYFEFGCLLDGHVWRPKPFSVLVRPKIWLSDLIRCSSENFAQFCRLTTFDVWIPSWIDCKQKPLERQQQLYPRVILKIILRYLKTLNRSVSESWAYEVNVSDQTCYFQGPHFLSICIEKMETTSADSEDRILVCGFKLNKKTGNWMSVETICGQKKMLPVQTFGFLRTPQMSSLKQCVRRA